MYECVCTPYSAVSQRVGSSNGSSASQSSPVAVHLEKQEEKHGEEENDASLDFYSGGFVPGPEFTE